MEIDARVQQWLRMPGVVDIIAAEGTYFALTSEHHSIPGCTVVLLSQLPQYVSRFLLTGYSHRYGCPYADIAGLRAWLVFTYSLEELTPTQKQTMSHALSGTAGRSGVLASWQGRKLGRSAFMVPKAAESEAVAFLNHWRARFTSEVVFRAS